MSGNMKNMRNSFLHFLADNLPVGSVHPIRFQKNAPQYNSMQIGKLNVAFHDGTYSVKSPASQFVTIDILDDDENDAIDLEEATVALLQQAGLTPLLDYSDPRNPVQVSNSLIYWNPQGIKFRTVSSIDYFHRAAVLTLFTRYV